MSSILKALKKLEEEQAGRQSSLPTGAGGQFVTASRAGQPVLLLICGVGAGLLLAVGLYALLGRSGSDHPVVSVRPEQAPSVAATPAQPQISTPQAGPVAVRSPAPAVLSRPETPARAPGNRANAIPAPAPVKIEPPIVRQPASRIVTATAGEVSRVAAAEIHANPVEQVQIERREIPAPGQQWSVANLVVSDVLATAEGGRMAIINGLPVMEGTMVEDALVREIHPDHVLFVIDGKSVAVPLSSQR